MNEPTDNIWTAINFLGRATVMTSNISGYFRTVGLAQERPFCNGRILLPCSPKQKEGKGKSEVEQVSSTSPESTS